jgi:hypothetical protein
VDRKYGHRGYRDAEKQDKKDKSHDRKPPSGGPRGADQFGPRTPRMVGTVTRARCSNCGAVLTPGFDPNGTCPKCQAELHCCKQCRFFDSGAHPAHPGAHLSQGRQEFLHLLRISHDHRKRYRANVLHAAERAWFRASQRASAPHRCPPSLREPFQKVARFSLRSHHAPQSAFASPHRLAWRVGQCPL